MLRTVEAAERPCRALQHQTDAGSVPAPASAVAECEVEAFRDPECHKESVQASLKDLRSCCRVVVVADAADVEKSGGGVADEDEGAADVAAEESIGC